VIDKTHSSLLESWVASASGHPDFPVQNLPLGIFSPPCESPRPGVAIGDAIFDLTGVAGLLPEAVAATLHGTTLNSLLALPKLERVALRRSVSALLTDVAHRRLVEPLLHSAADCIAYPL
jgi:fumarylacetoacetase